MPSKLVLNVVASASELIDSVYGDVQLASVIAYLHANDIIHRDIKTSNIFLEENGLLKLGDLGMCRHLVQPTERPKTTAGTLNYMSPEVTRERSYSKPTDIWGLGCLMFEVLNSHNPIPCIPWSEVAVLVLSAAT